MSQRVVIIQGSKTDNEYVGQIVSALEPYKIPVIRRIASAHRTPLHLQRILDQYGNEDKTVFITVAGLSDALSGTVAARYSGRVIACPPDFKEYPEMKIFSSTRTSKGIEVKFAKNPQEAAITAKFFLDNFDFLNRDSRLERLKKETEEKGIQTILDDARLQGIEDPLPYTFFKKGKVRDVYDLNDELLIRATDRISAFDVVLPNKIPHKGEVLNMLSCWWFDKTSHIMPNHIVKQYDRISVIVKKAKVLPIEFVVRGYLYGSVLDAYRKGESYCGIKLPEGMQKAQKLPYPILTPTTKAESGHDLPLTMKELANVIGSELAENLGNKCMEIYLFAAGIAEKAGIICADTKIEAGLLEDGTPILIDELLTPDSSRWWPLEKYEIGKDQESYDKQPVRDWLVNVAKWDKNPPSPILPEDVVEDTSKRYIEAYEKLSGSEFLK